MNRTVFLSDLTSHSYGSRTPSAPAKEGFAAFIDGAATPPNLGGEFRVTFRVHDHSRNEVQKLETPMRTPLLTTPEKMAKLQSPPRRGGVAAPRKKKFPFLYGADGVVAHTPMFQNSFHHVTCERPPRPCHIGTDSFLMARPPLLCKEGNAP